MHNRCPALRPCLIGLLATLWLSGCHDDKNALPDASSAAPSAADAVHSLSIKGVPPNSVVAGSMYSFTPTVSGSSTRVMFTIAGQPEWARFNPYTGSLSGMPSAKDEGVTGHITISASNGSSRASMTPFAIEVKGADLNAESATISWVAPTENTDGTPVTSLAGYYVHYGSSPDELTHTITVPGAASTTCIITGLTEGTYYFAVVAYTAAGTKSGQSNLASHTI